MLFVWITADAKEKGLHFDNTGKIIAPDQEYMWQGYKDEKDGFRDSALKNFKKAAEFGNYHAMSLVGLYMLHDKDYTMAHAWLNLINLDKFPNREYMNDIIKGLENLMTSDELQKAKLAKAELLETYGNYPALLRREKWKKSMRFTGTRIKGHIPPHLTFTLNSGVVVNGSDAKHQVDNFVYEYEFDIGQGEVTLDDVEIIEDNQN